MTRVIEQPGTCRAFQCTAVIDVRWRVCAACWKRIPFGVRATLIELRGWCSRTPELHPDDRTKLNTPHHLFRLLWREAMEFLRSGQMGASFPWTRAAPERPGA
jgi:hypothetical protein